MLSRIDEANFELLPNVDLRFALLDENPHSDRFRHESEFKWTVSARCEKNSSFASRAYEFFNRGRHDLI